LEYLKKRYDWMSSHHCNWTTTTTTTMMKNTSIDRSLLVVIQKLKQS
jgi:hypothetical protein